MAEADARAGGAPEAQAFALLSATEALAAMILDDVSPAMLREVRLERDRAFEELRSAMGSLEGKPGAALRAVIARVRALDAAMLSAVPKLEAALLVEQRGLQRRKTALEAHANRDRQEPRLLTVRV